MQFEGVLAWPWNWERADCDQERSAQWMARTNRRELNTDVDHGPLMVAVFIYKHHLKGVIRPLCHWCSDFGDKVSPGDQTRTSRLDGQMIEYSDQAELSRCICERIVAKKGCLYFHTVRAKLREWEARANGVDAESHFDKPTS